MVSSPSLSPTASHHTLLLSSQLSDWQKFAVREYILLSAEDEDDEDDFDDYSQEFPGSPLRPY